MFIQESKIRVRYVETDQMGVVHHSNYYPWFEIGRQDFFEAVGMRYEQLEEEGLLFPLVESGCVYKEAAKYPDEILLKTWIHDFNGIKITFSYDVWRAKDQKLLATGKTAHVFVTKEFKLVNLKKARPDLWNIIEDLRQ